VAVICVKENGVSNLTFEQHKWILTCYWKMENVTEVQRRWRNGFRTPRPTWATVTKIRDKSVVDGTVQNVNKGRSGKPRSSTQDEGLATVLEDYTQSPTKSVISICILTSDYTSVTLNTMNVI
jgi:hypothetical protein